MTTSARARAVATTLGLAACVACSADAVTLTEPTLETPGAFIAAEDDYDVVFLVRTLQTVPFDDDALMFLILYAVEPGNFEEARELAKNPELTIGNPKLFFSRNLLQRLPHEVVWFRSLAEYERNFVQ